MNAKASLANIRKTDGTEWLLQVEAVNLAHFVFDTDDLSTIRGGGLMLLNAISKERVTGWAGIELEEIMTGASRGIFRFQAKDDAAAQEIEKRVKIALETTAALDYKRDDESDGHARLSHATFIVAITRFDGDFDQARKHLLASVRFSQLRQPTTVLPANKGNDCHLVCALDSILPASSVESHQHKTRRISRAAAARREYGRAQKQNFYKDRTGVDLAGREFARDFRELTSNPPPESRRLSGKLAILYMDGNKFGKLLESEAMDIDAQREFSTVLKKVQDGLLGKLLSERVTKDVGWMNGNKLRLETLLWGGDEMIWVVPAWKGWELLEFVFEHSDKWSFRAKHRLTHGAGIAFASDNTPIGRLKSLIHDLANEAKRVWDYKKPKNLVSCEILESQDYVGADLEAYRASLYPPGSGAEARVLDLGRISSLRKTKKALGGGFPRSKLHAHARYVLLGVNEASAKSAEAIIKELEAYEKDLMDLFHQFGGCKDVAWIHLHHLWDYL